MKTLKNAFGSENGSALVGAVALCVIMGIGVAGLMGVSRNTVSQEVESLDDVKAYLAAEAGLFTGTSWFKNRTGASLNTFNFTHTHGTDVIPVNVEIIPNPAGNVRLVSTVNWKRLSYIKQLEWTINALPPLGSSAYQNFTDQTDPDDSEIVMGTRQKNYDGLVSNSRIDGPVHFNSPLRITNTANKPLFRSKVTIFNPPEGGIYNNYGSGKWDYNSYYDSETGIWRGGGLAIGVENHESRDQAYLLDNVFQSELKIVSERACVECDPSANGITLYDLDFSAGESSLRFGVNMTGDACITGCVTIYNNSGTAIRTIVYGNAPTVIRADFPLTVRGGAMDGAVTVLTTPGNDIIVDLGSTTSSTANSQFNLTYRNVNPQDAVNNWAQNANPKMPWSKDVSDKNFGIAANRNDVLALYSGRHIRIGPDDDATGSSAKMGIITAHLFAPNGQVAVAVPLISNSYGKIHSASAYRAIGVMTSKYWWNYYNSSDIDNVFQVFYDQRDVNAPCIAYSGTGSQTPELNNNQLIKTRYRETNTSRETMGTI
ncbi:MAG: hypothetical protein LBI42_03255 [Chitinispirillales bacterium]|nr:hypothetical protein [Chitinispirillales bacterium]